MSRFEVRIAGLGGQGIVTAGVMIGRAASVFGGKNRDSCAILRPRVQRRSLQSRSHRLRREDTTIPKIRKPSVVAVMSQEAYQKNLGDLNGSAIVILDPDMVQERPVQSLPRRAYRVPATRIAEGLGKTDSLEYGDGWRHSRPNQHGGNGVVEKAIAKYTPRGTEQLNLNAFKSGREYAQRLLQEQAVTVSKH